MVSDPSQAYQTNSKLFPCWTITEISKIYGYSRSHIRNIVDAGFVSAHKINFSNRTVILVHTDSMNRYVERQLRRRAS